MASDVAVAKRDNQALLRRVFITDEPLGVYSFDPYTALKTYTESQANIEDATRGDNLASVA